MTQHDSSAMILTTPSDREIQLTRVFNAPRELVFRAMTDPELLPRWWGPRHMTMVVCETDIRPGGRYRFVHRAEDGSEFGFRGEFREIVPPERVVQTFEFEGMPGHISVETMTLTAQDDGKTLMTTTSLFDTQEDRDGMLQSGMAEGAGQTYDRLEELLPELS